MFNALHKMLHDAMDTGAADRNLPVVPQPDPRLLAEVGLGNCVPHQARHTLATSNRRP